MDRVTAIRAGVAAIGIALWGWGYNHDSDSIRLAGMFAMGLALVLRFAKRRAPPKDDAAN